VTKSGSPERRRSGACFEAVHPFVTALRSDLVSAGPRGALSLSGLNRAFKAPGKPASQRANFEYANRPDHQAREDSTGASARRGAAWSMWPKEGWPAQHGARERREVSLVEITTGVHRWAGGTWGLEDKTNPSKLAMDVIRSMCTPNGIPRGAG
jgi:hypothetical protein